MSPLCAALINGVSPPHVRLLTSIWCTFTSCLTKSCRPARHAKCKAVRPVVSCWLIRGPQLKIIARVSTDEVFISQQYINIVCFPWSKIGSSMGNPPSTIYLMISGFFWWIAYIMYSFARLIFSYEGLDFYIFNYFLFSFAGFWGFGAFH